jgi:hypothetical protein
MPPENLFSNFNLRLSSLTNLEYAGQKNILKILSILVIKCGTFHYFKIFIFYQNPEGEGGCKGLACISAADAHAEPRHLQTKKLAEKSTI